MPYSCDIRSSLQELDLADWRSLAGESDLFMDPRFVAAVEHGQRDAGKYWSVIVRDGTRRPVAIACLSLLPIDLAMLAGGAVMQIGGMLRQLFPNALRYHALFCGLPVSAGQSHLRIAAEADATEVLRSLVDEMERLARTAGARFLIFKEFGDLASERVLQLANLGFFLGESPPMNVFPTGFRSFEEYRARLKAPYRSKIVRSQRKFVERGLRSECLTEGRLIAEQFTDEVYRMYLAVIEKSSVRLETLSAEWFREIARAFDRESVWTAIYDGDRLLAWAYGLLSGGIYHSLFGGVNYARNPEADAYFNLMYHELDFALQQGANEIHLGQTADDFKSRLGATQEKRWFYLKPLRWKAKAVLNLAADRVLPRYPPPVERHVFQAAALRPQTDSVTQTLV